MVLLAVASCSDSLGPGGDLPLTYHLVSHLFGESEGLSVACLMEIDVELTQISQRTFELVEYAGQAGGYVGRTILNSQGDGISLIPEVYYPAMTVRFYRNGRLEIKLFDPTPSDGRFWHELGQLSGTASGDGGSGEWTCAPLDIMDGGWIDTAGTATGTWRLAVPVHERLTPALDRHPGPCSLSGR